MKYTPDYNGFMSLEKQEELTDLADRLIKRFKAYYPHLKYFSGRWLNDDKDVSNAVWVDLRRVRDITDGQLEEQGFIYVKLIEVFERKEDGTI